MEFFTRTVDHRHIVDVFEGKQYDVFSWSRLKAGRHGVFVQKGKPLSHRVLKQLINQINPQQDMQLIMIEG